MAQETEQTPNVTYGPWRRYRRRLKQAMNRAWKAAQSGRLVADWLSAGGDINDELRQALNILRSRARELEQNDDLARRYLQLVETHIVGPAGMRLQVRGELARGGLDTRGNARVEAAWAAWSRRGVCDVTRRLSLLDIQRLAIRTAARDGEILIRLHDAKESADAPYAFQIEILDPVRLDYTYNTRLQNGNRVRLGVELDRFNRPVAYHLRRQLTGQSPERERVPADDIIHAYIAERPEQIRGVSWMAGSMLRMHMLGAYEEAAVTAARVGAAKMGFFKSENGDLSPLADDVEGEGELIEEADPGHFGHLPPGYEFVDWNPQYPHEQFDSFMSRCQHTIAAGLGVSYHALTGDLNGVNFSSIRSGTLEEREHWMVRQRWFADAVMRPIYLRWLSRAAFTSRLEFNGLSDEQVAQRFSDHTWQGRRWSWVDPMKDMQASIEAIRNGLKSPQQVAAELGEDIETIYEQIAGAQAAAQAAGITLDWMQEGKNAGTQNQGGNPAA